MSDIPKTAEKLTVGSSTEQEQKIREVFMLPDAEAVLCMPRPKTEKEDIWAWEHERTGLFTVRSTYRVLLDSKETLNAAESSSEVGSNWKSLWKLKVMPKIQVFWWRVLKNFLPTYSELSRRHMKEVSNCPLCGHEEESLYHSMSFQNYTLQLGRWIF